MPSVTVAPRSREAFASVWTLNGSREISGFLFRGKRNMAAPATRIFSFQMTERGSWMRDSIMQGRCQGRLGLPKRPHHQGTHVQLFPAFGASSAVEGVGQLSVRRTLVQIHCYYSAVM